jgi:hypothetical protein
MLVQGEILMTAIDHLVVTALGAPRTDLYRAVETSSLDNTRSSL